LEERIALLMDNYYQYARQIFAFFRAKALNKKMRVEIVLIMDYSTSIQFNYFIVSEANIFDMPHQ